MKHIFIILFLIPTICFGQETATTSSGKKVILNKDGTWKYSDLKPSKGLSKKLSDDKSKYLLSNVVQVESGQGEKIDVEFNASVDKQIWDNLTKGKSELEYFELIAGLLSIKAQYTLKNNLSFTPFKKQFFMYSDGVFMSSYKMSGRNGYGNLIETSALVKCNPENPDQ